MTDPSGGGLAGVIVGGLVTIIVALIGSDRVTAKKEPITREDRIKSGGGDIAALAHELARVAQEAADARSEASAAHVEATAAREEAAIVRARNERLIEWARTIHRDWPTIRQRKTAPPLPE